MRPQGQNKLHAHTQVGRVHHIELEQERRKRVKINVTSSSSCVKDIKLTSGVISLIDRTSMSIVSSTSAGS